MHTPNAHRHHTNGHPCGCYVGNATPVACPICGAAYEAEEVTEFSTFWCYDCKASLPRGLAGRVLIAIGDGKFVNFEQVKPNE